MNTMKKYLNIKKYQQNYLLVFFILTTICFLLKILYFKLLPVWREDTFFYIEGARVISEGGILYKNFGDIKPPAIFFLYAALIKIFGYSNLHLAIKITTVLFQSLTAFLIYVVARRLTNSQKAFGSAFLFAVVSSTDCAYWPSNVMLLYMLPFMLQLYFLVRDDFQFKSINLFLAGFFVALSTLMATNTILYTLFFPILALLYNPNGHKIKEFFRCSITAFAGFILPFFILVLYWLTNDALKDAYWWTVKWASLYGSQKEWYKRIGNFFVGIRVNREMWSLIACSLLAIYDIIKNKRVKQKNSQFFFVLLFLTMLVRMLMPKSAERYSMFILPAAAFGWAFINFEKYKSIVKKIAVAILIVWCSGYYIYNQYLVCHQQMGIFDTYARTQQTVDWLQENTSPQSTILVWPEGWNVPYCSQRATVTSIYSIWEHLTKNMIWLRNNEECIEIPWEKFFAELQANQPTCVIDFTKGFIYRGMGGGPKMKAYYQRWLKFIEQNYELTAELDNSQVWKLKK